MCKIEILQLEEQEEYLRLQERDLCKEGPVTVYYFVYANEDRVKKELKNKYENVIFPDFCTADREDLTLQLLQSLLMKPLYIPNNTFSELRNRFNSIINSPDHGIDIQYDQIFCDIFSAINACGNDVFIYLGNRALIEWGNMKDRQRFKKINNIENDRLHFIVFTNDKRDVESWDTNEIHDSSTLIRMDVSKVYFSYNWEPKSKKIVETIEKALNVEHITSVRDVKDCNYRDNIREFEETIGKGKKIIVVFSKEYLFSLSCMFEMNRMIAEGEIEERIFPIVTFNLSDNELNVLMLEVYSYWEDALQKVSQQSAKLDGNVPKVIQTQMTDIHDIINNRDTVWEYLRYICSKNPSQLLDNDCHMLIEELKKIKTTL